MQNSSGRFTSTWLLCIILTVLFCFCNGVKPTAQAQGAPDYIHGWMRLGISGSAFDGGNMPPAWSPDGNHVALIQLKAVHVLNANTGLLEWTYPCPGHWGAAAFASNSTIVIRDGTVSNENRLRIFDINTHALLTTYILPLAQVPVASRTNNFWVDPTGQYVVVSYRVVRLSDGLVIPPAFGHGPDVEGFGPLPNSIFADDQAQSFYTTLQGFTSPNEALSPLAFFDGVIVWSNDLTHWVHVNGGYTRLTNGPDGHGGGFSTILDFAAPFRLVNRPTFSPDSSKLCMFGQGVPGALGMWDVTGNVPVLSWSIPSYVGNHVLTFSPNSSVVADYAYSISDADSRIFSAYSGLTDIRLSFGSGTPVFAQSPNGSEVAACSVTADLSVNREIRIFQGGTGFLLRTLPIAGVTRLAYLSDTTLAIARFDGFRTVIEVRDSTSGTTLWSTPQYLGVYGFDVVPNKYVIASLALPGDNIVAVSRWNADGTNRRDITRTILGNLAVSPDGLHMAGVIDNGPSSHYIITYNVETLAFEYQRISPTREYNNILKWSPNSNHLADVGRYTNVTVYDLAANVSFNTGDGTCSLAAAWSSSGNYLAVSRQPFDTPPSKISFYSVAGNALTEVKMVDSGVGETFVTGLQFTPDGSGMLYGTYGGTVGRFDVPEPVFVPQKLSAISLSPTSVVGGNNSTGTVTIDLPAGASGTVVSLTSLNNSLAHVPASVTVPAGLTTATFTVTTEGVAANTVVGIQGTCNGVTQSANLTLKPAALMSISLSPSSVTGGTDSTATVTLTGKAPTDSSVTLSTANGAASVPATVTIPGGASSATFTIHTVPVNSNSAGTVSALFKGLTKSATLTVKAPVLSALALNPTVVNGGASVTGTVTLSGPAAVDTTVTLGSANSAAHPPVSLVVTNGSSSATFNVTTDQVTANVIGAITASLAGVSKPVTLTVKAAVLNSLALSSSSVSGGSTVTGTVSFMTAVGADTTVTLGSANSAAHPPASVVVPVGATSATFTVNTDVVSAKTMGNISATYNGVIKTAALTVNPFVLSSLSVTMSSIPCGGSIPGTVTFAAPVPVGISVNLTNTNPALSVNSSVWVPAGATSALFTIFNPVFVTSNVAGVITASYGGVSKSVTLTVKPGAYSGFTLTPNIVVGGNTVTARVQMDGLVEAGTVVTLTNTNTKASLPFTTVTFTERSFFIEFTMTTVPTATNVTGTVSAKVGSVKKSATLIVTP